MDTNLLFDSEQERIATEKVLAAIKVKSINEEIDELIADILRYAKEIDNYLEENGYTKRYLDKVSMISENDSLVLDNDLTSLDFRIKEIIEDLIKRINTRIDMVKNSSNNLNLIRESYNIDEIDLEKEIKTAKLTEESFI